MRVDQLVLGDAEQPRDGRGGPDAVAAAGDQRGGERLGRQVGGELGIAGAAGEVSDHGVDMAVVEHPEVLGVGRQEEMLIVRVVGHCTELLASAGRCVTG